MDGADRAPIARSGTRSLPAYIGATRLRGAKVEQVPAHVCRKIGTKVGERVGLLVGEVTRVLRWREEPESSRRERPRMGPRSALTFGGGEVRAVSACSATKR